jgi:ribosomal protein S21
MYKNRNRRKQINSLITVTSEECGGNPERMIKKFSKKVKRDGILEESRERMRFKKNSAKRSEDKRKRKRLIENLNKKQKELINIRDGVSRSRNTGRRR